MSNLFEIFAAIIFSTVSFYSVRFCKRGKFFADVPIFLLPTGIYVWGDGLVLGPFWLASAGIWLLLDFSLLLILRYYLLFLTVRSAYEVIYWVSHQMHQKDYVPPLLRGIKWLSSEQHGIIYQLIHTSIVVISLAIYIYTFNY